MMTTRNKTIMIIRNIFMITKKVQFSTTCSSQADKDKIVSTHDKLKAQVNELMEEREYLKDDLENIGTAVTAASKISNAETPSTEEEEVLSNFKENYPVFFDSEGEQENASSSLNRIMGVKRYIVKELGTNKKSIYAIRKIQEKGKYPAANEDPMAEGSSITKDPVKGVESASTIEDPMIEGSGSALKRKDPMLEGSGSALKRKAEYASESEESSSSKKSRPSPSEFIDDLPYNPFDDLGTD